MKEFPDLQDLVHTWSDVRTMLERTIDIPIIVYKAVSSRLHKTFPPWYVREFHLMVTLTSLSV
jgi:hypothetical protein